MDDLPSPSIRNLYPDLDDQECTKAEDKLNRYLELVLRIFERIEANPQPDQLTENTGTLPCTQPAPDSSA